MLVYDKENFCKSGYCFMFAPHPQGCGMHQNCIPRLEICTVPTIKMYCVTLRKTCILHVAALQVEIDIDT